MSTSRLFCLDNIQSYFSKHLNEEELKDFPFWAFGPDFYYKNGKGLKDAWNRLHGHIYTLSPSSSIETDADFMTQYYKSQKAANMTNNVQTPISEMNKNFKEFQPRQLYEFACKQSLTVDEKDPAYFFYRQVMRAYDEYLMEKTFEKV